MVGVGLFSILSLALMRAYLFNAKSVTQNRVKSQITEFAQGEIDNVTRLAHRPAPTGEKVPYGYWHEVIGSTEALLDYPRQLMDAGASGADGKRFKLYRTVQVSTFTAENDSLITSTHTFKPERPGEYRRVRVTLRDSVTPARFSPVTLETKVRRPNPDSLDMRQAVNAQLAGKILDAKTNDPLSGVYLRIEPGEHTAVSNSQGEFFFPSLNTYTTGYVLTYTINNYWARSDALPQLSGGTNHFPSQGSSVTLWPVQRAAVEVTVRDKITNNALPNARVYLDHAGPLPSARYNGPSYNTLTNAQGKAHFSIPIPIAGQNTYDKYRLSVVERAGYLKEYTPNGVLTPITLNLHTQLPEQVLIQMYPLKIAFFQVKVKTKVGGSPISGARVAALRDPWSEVISKGWTLASGTITVAVPVNTIADKTADQRRVMVFAQRVGFFASVNNEVDLIAGQTTPLPDFALGTHLFRAQLAEHYLRISSPSQPWRIPIGYGFHLQCSNLYYGHDFVQEWGHTYDFNHAKRPMWGERPSETGSFEEERLITVEKPNVLRTEWGSDDNKYVVANQEGFTKITCDSRYTFNYSGPEFGPGMVVSFPFDTPGVLHTGYVEVVDGDALSAGLMVSVQGHHEIDPGGTNWYGVDASASVNLTHWEWRVVGGPGDIPINKRDEGWVPMTAFSNATPGHKIVLQVKAKYNNDWTDWSPEFEVTVRDPGTPDPDIWAPGPTGPLYFDGTFRITPQVSHAPSGATIEYVLVDESGHELLAEQGTCPLGFISNLTGPTTLFQAARVVGNISVRAKLRLGDEVLDTHTIDFNILPSGGTSTGG